MSEAQQSSGEKGKKENSSPQKQSSEAKPSQSLTHKTAGVAITVTVKDEKAGDEEKSSQTEAKERNEKNQKARRKRIVIAVVAIGAVALLIAGVILWFVLRQFVSTDDAYIDGDVTQISARISAPMIGRHIEDNQLVHAGDLLIELDPADFDVALAQARAQVVSSRGKLAQAQAQVTTAQAAVTQAVAEVGAAQVQADNASRDLQRYQEVDERARSRQQLDNALTAKKNADAQLEQARAKKNFRGCQRGQRRSVREGGGRRTGDFGSGQETRRSKFVLL